MNSSVMGIINLQYQENAVQELSKNRSVASVPFAGRYRLIDFAVSSMVNSGINHVGVLLPNKPRSILDHLRSGKDWDLALRHNGLFYLPAVEEFIITWISLSIVSRSMCLLLRETSYTI